VSFWKDLWDLLEMLFLKKLISNLQARISVTETSLGDISINFRS